MRYDQKIAAAKSEYASLHPRPLFCRDDEDPVEFQRLADQAAARIDAEVRHEDLCRISRALTGGRPFDLRDDRDRRANETLKALIGEAFKAANLPAVNGAGVAAAKQGAPALSAPDEPSLPCAASERGAYSTNIAAAGPSACAATEPHSQSEEEKANHDCLAKRRPGEPMFILLGRDPDAHNIVRIWAERRLAAGGDPEHCQMGLDTSERMKLYAADPGNAPASAPPASAYPSEIAFIASDLHAATKAWLDYLDTPDWLAEDAHLTERRLLDAMRAALSSEAPTPADAPSGVISGEKSEGGAS
jgi:hypothetical protein